MARTKQTALRAQPASHKAQLPSRPATAPATAPATDRSPAKKVIRARSKVSVRQRRRSMLAAKIRSEKCAQEIARRVWIESCGKKDHDLFVQTMDDIYKAYHYETASGKHVKKSPGYIMGLRAKNNQARVDAVDKTAYLVTKSRHDVSAEAARAEKQQSCKGGMVKHM